MQPISLIVAGLKNDEGIVRSPAPAVGACRFSPPQRQDPDRLRGDLAGQDVAGTFVTDVKTDAKAGGDGTRDAKDGVKP